MMMEKNDRGGYYRYNAFVTAGESEGSDRSEQVDAEITASEDSSAAFCDPMQVISFSNLSEAERKDIVHKLTSDLEQLRILQKKVTNVVTVSTCNDILGCINELKWHLVENFRKTSVITCGRGKKVNPVNFKARGWNRGPSGRFEVSEKPASTKSTADIILMKQCETLLKRLMSHQYGWIFNTPVDVVKWNIPDYHNVIKHPMDFGKIKGKMASSAYSSPLEFLADVRLTFSNAMTYNMPGNDIHKIADTLRKYFEARWKAIEKKLPVTKPQLTPQNSGFCANVETAKAISPAKKRKIEIMCQEIDTASVKRVMKEHEKHNLGRELESLLGEMPTHIIYFLREHSSSGRETGEDKIEINIDELSNDTLFTLRKLLDDYLEEKQKNQGRAEPCEIELLNESGLRNSSVQLGNDLADEEIDIGGNEPPSSSYPLVKIEKDTSSKSSKCVSPDSESSSFESECDDVKASITIKALTMPEMSGPGAQLDEKTISVDPLDVNQSVSGLELLEHTSQEKPSSVESDCCPDAASHGSSLKNIGDTAQNKRQFSPHKLYGAPFLKNRFADTILKAREKTLSQVDKGDPGKLCQEWEELEMQKQKECARLQAEAKTAEAAEAAEARQKREVVGELSLQGLLTGTRWKRLLKSMRILASLKQQAQITPRMA